MIYYIESRFVGVMPNRLFHSLEEAKESIESCLECKYEFDSFQFTNCYIRQFDDEGEQVAVYKISVKPTIRDITEIN